MMLNTIRSSATARLCGLLAAGLLLSGASSPAKAAGDAEMPGELLVKLRSTQALGPLLRKHRLSLMSQFGARPIYRLKVVGLADVHDKITALSTELDVLIVEPNFVHQSPESRRRNVSWAHWRPRGLHRPVGATGAAPARGPPRVHRCRHPRGGARHRRRLAASGAGGSAAARLRLRGLRHRSVGSGQPGEPGFRPRHACGRPGGAGRARRQDHAAARARHRRARQCLGAGRSDAVCRRSRRQSGHRTMARRSST